MQRIIDSFKEKEMDHFNNLKEYEEKIAILLKRVDVEGMTFEIVIFINSI